MPSRYTQIADRAPAPPARRRRLSYSDGGFELREGKLFKESVNVSFAIMAHKKREAWVPYLQEKIPSAKVVWDKYNDRHETGLRSIKAHGANADWHVVVQDDVILADDFVEGVQEALRFVPDGSPVGFYYGGKGSKNSAHATALSEAIVRGASWLVRRGPVWGPAIAYPVSTIGDLTEFYEKSSVQNYDRRAKTFYDSRNARCWYSVPSLVDHRVEDNPSLSGHHKPNRSAGVFVGPRSALSVDWSGPALWDRRF